MNLKNLLNKTLFGKIISQILRKKEYLVKKEELNINSSHLNRSVFLQIFYNAAPNALFKSPFRLILFNDGQDMEAVDLINAMQKNTAKPLLCVGIYPQDRMQEYGTFRQVDYANRGLQAPAYTNFIINELLPYLENNYKLSQKAKDRAFAGFSLGGLSAIDIVWNHPHIFGSVGVFSGALWWRSKAFKAHDPDADRIIHEMIKKDSIKGKKQLRFWLQTGTHDETDDRNNNGIIDAIDDTLDLIKILKQEGFADKAIKYVEVDKGEHNPATWKMVLPDFLKWF